MSEELKVSDSNYRVASFVEMNTHLWETEQLHSDNKSKNSLSMTEKSKILIVND